MLTLILDCDMIFMLGRSGKECPFFRNAPQSVILSAGRSPKSKDLRTGKTAKVTFVRRSFDSLALAQDDSPCAPEPNVHNCHERNKKEAAPQPKRNDPWRFRQQSSRVISIPFWYLTSLFTSLSIGSDMDIQDGKCQNLYV